MNPVKIISDSTCDLTPEILAANHISIVPLYITFGESVYADGVDITADQIYTLIKEKGALPKTSAPSPADFAKEFGTYICQGYDIVYIGLSSDLSSTWQNANTAAQEFPPGRIFIIDSRNLSTGIGLLLLKACDYTRQGFSAKEICFRIHELVPKVKTAFVIDTLEYLYKGGRCSALQHIIGGLLRMHPVIEVVEGKMIAGQKLRGKKKNALDVIFENVTKEKERIDPERIFITHSMDLDEADYLKIRLEDLQYFQQVIITKAGCVVSSHCGEKTVGILYLFK